MYFAHGEYIGNTGISYLHTGMLLYTKYFTTYFGSTEPFQKQSTYTACITWGKNVVVTFKKSNLPTLVYETHD